MKPIQILLSAATACLLTPGIVTADVVSVFSADNLYSAGLTSPVAPGGGAGVIPLQIDLTPGLGTFQFQYLSGTVSPNQFDGPFNLDGNGAPTYSTAINPYGGLSGFISDHGFALLGVFLTAAAPQAPPPPTHDFSSAGIGPDFLTHAPLIGQVFLIGDRVTSGYQAQTFFAPAGATRLFLGFGDANYFIGDAGQYQDNIGSLNVNVIAVPEPAIPVILLVGSALVAVIYRQNNRQSSAGS